MIENFQKTNTSRINQLTGMMEGTDLTVSIQQLMQLSLSKEQEKDLDILKDSKDEVRDLKIHLFSVHYTKNLNV